MALQFTVDGFRIIYLCIASFMWVVALIFSKEYMRHYSRRRAYYLFTMLTYLAVVGVLLSADLYTTFLFFEIMSFTSYVWVVQDRREESMRAGATYLGIAVIGGLVMLMGLFLLYDQIGTLNIAELSSASAPYLGSSKLYVAGGCILFGFAAKAGIYPLHVWLPKAHPVAPAPASALLSGLLTKIGIFGILILSTQIFIYDELWHSILLILGVITMFFGAVLALFSMNLKRTLACSSVSQIGFITLGIGMQGLLQEHNTIAIWGIFLHMVNHSMMKLILFSISGVVAMNLHALDLNTIRGFGRKKPLLMVCFLIGGLGLAGIPLWSGYISKTLLHESVVEYIHLLEDGLRPLYLSAGHIQSIEWIFLLSGGMTVAYILKLFFTIFVQKNTEQSVQDSYDSYGQNYMNLPSKIALVVSAAFLWLIGLMPHFIAEPIARYAQGFMNGHDEPAHTIHYFSWTNLEGALISLGIGLLLYLFVVRKWLLATNPWPWWLDLENLLYRPILLTGLPILFGTLARITDRFADRGIIILRKTAYRDSAIPEELSEGNVFTHLIGGFLQACVNLLNHTIWMDRPSKKPMEHKVAVLWEELSENFRIITRSLSFGLMLVSLGMLFIFAYLLVIVQP